MYMAGRYLFVHGAVRYVAVRHVAVWHRTDISRARQAPSKSSVSSAKATLKSSIDKCDISRLIAPEASLNTSNASVEKRDSSRVIGALTHDWWDKKFNVTQHNHYEYMLYISSL